MDEVGEGVSDVTGIKAVDGQVEVVDSLSVFLSYLFEEHGF